MPHDVTSGGEPRPQCGRNVEVDGHPAVHTLVNGGQLLRHLPGEVECQGPMLIYTPAALWGRKPCLTYNYLNAEWSNTTNILWTSGPQSTKETSFQYSALSEYLSEGSVWPW